MAAYVAVALGAGVAGYFDTFTRYEYYDDEGYVAVSVKEFVSGGSLYTDVYSQYGPFPYELWGALFKLTGEQVSTNSIRFVTIALWLAIALTAGITVHRLTRRLALGLVAALVAFATADTITAEPFHPDALVALLVLGVAAAAVLLHERPRAAMAVTGALLAAAVLTKVNVGGLGIAAVAYALATTVPVLARSRVIAPLVVAACIALPLVLMTPDLDAEWAQNFALIVAFGMVALSIVAFRAAPRPGSPEAPGMEALIPLVAGFAAAAGVIVGVIVVAGTSVGDLIDGVLIEPLGQRDIFTYEARLPRAVFDLTLIGCVAAFVARRVRGSGERSASAAGAVLRILAALILLLGIAAALPLNLQPDPTLLGLAIPLAWLAACPPGGAADRVSPYVRVLLPALAVLGSLHAYPVYGSQVGFSAILFVPAGGLVLSDGLRELEASSAGWAAARGVALSAAITVALAALILKLAAQEVVQPAVIDGKAWRQGQGLPFYGASRVRLQPSTTGVFADVVTQLRTRCDSFLTLPGLNSFYLWTGMDPPTGLNATSWMYLLDAEQQQRVVDAAKPVRRLCALRNDEALEFWVNQGPPPKRLAVRKPLPRRPLLRFVTEEFETFARIGPYRVMLRKP